MFSIFGTYLFFYKWMEFILTALVLTSLFSLRGNKFDKLCLRRQKKRHGGKLHGELVK